MYELSINPPKQITKNLPPILCFSTRTPSHFPPPVLQKQNCTIKSTSARSSPKYPPPLGSSLQANKIPFDPSIVPPPKPRTWFHSSALHNSPPTPDSLPHPPPASIPPGRTPLNPLCLQGSFPTLVPMVTPLLPPGKHTTRETSSREEPPEEIVVACGPRFVAVLPPFLACFLPSRSSPWLVPVSRRARGCLDDGAAVRCVSFLIVFFFLFSSFLF